MDLVMNSQRNHLKDCQQIQHFPILISVFFQIFTPCEQISLFQFALANRWMQNEWWISYCNFWSFENQQIIENSWFGFSVTLFCFFFSSLMNAICFEKRWKRSSWTRNYFNLQHSERRQFHTLDNICIWFFFWFCVFLSSFFFVLKKNLWMNTTQDNNDEEGTIVSICKLIGNTTTLTHLSISMKKKNH